MITADFQIYEDPRSTPRKDPNRRTSSVDGSSNRGNGPRELQPEHPDVAGFRGNEKTLERIGIPTGSPLLRKRGREDDLDEDRRDRGLHPTKRRALVTDSGSPIARDKRGVHRLSAQGAYQGRAITLGLPIDQAGSQEQPIAVDDSDGSNDEGRPDPSHASHKTSQESGAGLLSKSSLDALESDIEAILRGNASSTSRGDASQTLPGKLRAVHEPRTASIKPRQMEDHHARSHSKQQTALFEVYHDAESDDPRGQMLYMKPHARENMLAPRPQNEKNIPPFKIPKPEVRTALGKRRRDEGIQHKESDKEEPVFKKPFLPRQLSDAPISESVARLYQQSNTKSVGTLTQQHRGELLYDSKKPSLPLNHLGHPILPYKRSDGAHQIPAKRSLAANNHPSVEDMRNKPNLSLNLGESRPLTHEAPRRGPVLPPGYASLPGFSDPNLFRPAEEVNQAPNEIAYQRPRVRRNGISEDRGTSREHRVLAAHNALQAALFGDDHQSASSANSLGQGVHGGNKVQNQNQNQNIPAKSPRSSRHESRFGRVDHRLSESHFDVYEDREPAKAPNQASIQAAPYNNNESAAKQSTSEKAASQDHPKVQGEQNEPHQEVIQAAITSNENPYDYYKIKRPVTRADQVNVCLALAHSHRFFLHQLGFKPQGTNITTSFAEQYAQMEAEYRHYVVDGMDPVLHEPWGDWKTGFDDWQCIWPALGNRFGECAVCKASKKE